MHYVNNQLDRGAGFISTPGRQCGKLFRWKGKAAEGV